MFELNFLLFLGSQCYKTLIQTNLPAIDLSQNASTFEECWTACETSPYCTAITYGNDGVCHLKASSTGSVTNAAFTTGILMCKSMRRGWQPNVSLDTTCYTTLLNTSINAETIYQLSDTFEKCWQTCESHDGCVALTYVGGVCKLKANRTALVSDATTQGITTGVLNCKNGTFF